MDNYISWFYKDVITSACPVSGVGLAKHLQQMALQTSLIY